MGLNNAIDITAAQRKIILALLRKHLPNTTAWVYGSRATWNARPQSDLDMVVFATPAQERGVSDLRDAFEESALPFRVDLFVWDAVPESFHKQIEAEHVVLVEKEERGGAGEWREIAFVQLLAGPVRNGIYKKKEFHGSGVKIVNMGELFAYPRLHSVHMKRVKLSEIEKRRFNIEKGDLLFARRSLVAEGAGKCSIVMDADEPTTFESSIIRARPDPTKANPLFLYYSFNSQPGLQALDSIRRQVAVAGITGSDLVQLNISVPPLPEQRVIAHILGTLDDKIELNRRMNETLEEMARALFKSWFVDFDPVHAKATLKHHAANQAPRQAAPTPAAVAARSEITPPLRGSRQAKGVSPQARRRGEIRRLYSPQILQKAQALRYNQTDAEGLLWHYLRHNQLGGHKFRRQQPIGPYIADFACLSQKLLIELDGSQHAARQDYDEKRDAFLREKGYRVLRFWNNEVFENCFGVLERIYAVLPHQPPLEGGSKDASLSGRGNPPPQQPAPDGLSVATPPQGGSDWTVERARTYLDEMGPSIAALFPDSFVDSELGPIPAGWEVKPLPDAMAINPPRPLRKGSVAPYLDMANMPTTGHTPAKVIERPFGSGMRFVNGDTLLARITPCLENGKTAYVDFLEEGQVGWGSTEYIVLRPKPPCPNEFAYCLARSADFREFVIQSMTGSSGRQRVPAEALSHYLMAVPVAGIVEGFGESCSASLCSGQ